MKAKKKAHSLKGTAKPYQNSYSHNEYKHMLFSEYIKTLPKRVRDSAIKEKERLEREYPELKNWGVE